MPHIAGLYIALSALLVVVLGYRVARFRMLRRVGLGFGEDKLLEQRVRAHGNAVEYLPLAMIQLVAIELQGWAPWIIHACGIVLIAARVLHAWGLARSRGTSIGRFSGTIATWAVMLAMAALLVARYLA
jgi:uncharacterized protein